MNTIKPATPLHPFRVGDQVKVRGTRKYGEVAALLSGFVPLIRYRNGKMEQVSPNLLEFNYGRC